MSENTKLWDILGRTDPAATKNFKRGGGFTGTAIKPMWSFRRMTEEFGPCGIGWGVGEPTFQVVAGENREVLVYCTTSIWYRQENTEARVYGVGGDKIVTHIKANEQYNRPERWESDDEAFKKAFTDAVTNALKLIGVGADVHMGLFDDNKYVNTMREEFSAPHEERPSGRVIESENPAQPQEHLKPNGKPMRGWRADGTRTTYWLKTNRSWDALKAMLDEDLVDCHSLVTLETLKNEYRKMAQEQRWNRQYLDSLTHEFNNHEKALMDQMDAKELAEVPLRDALTKSLAQHPISAG